MMGEDVESLGLRCGNNGIGGSLEGQRRTGVAALAWIPERIVDVQQQGCGGVERRW
jgi:hypothetical protein